MPRYVALDLDGWNIAIDIQPDGKGKWETPISEGDSLIAAIDWGKTQGREWEENGTVREAHAFVCQAYKNLSRGYRKRQSDGFLWLIGTAILSISTFLMAHFVAQIPPPSTPQPGGIFELLRIIAPFAGYASATFLGFLVPFGLRALYRVHRAEFRVRRSALETAAGTAGNACRSQDAFTVVLDGQNIVFPARFAGTISDGDRIVVVAEKITLTQMEAKSYKNLAIGASGSAASWASILLSSGWKAILAAGFFQGFLTALRQDGGEWDFVLWGLRFAALAAFSWVALSLIEDFFAWRLRREAHQRLKHALAAA